MQEIAIRIIVGCIVMFVSITASRAEEGCPTGQLLSPLNDICTPKSQYSELPLDDKLPMRFSAIQVSLATIYLQGIGSITKDTPDEFRRFLATEDAGMSKLLFLHSNGGNLLSALEFGRLIRQAGLNTVVGRSMPLEGGMDTYSYKLAVCASACAYAFLGGVSRSYTEDDYFGLHRFGAKDGQLSGDEAQVVSSRLAKYIEEMGVDQSMMEIASNTDFSSDIYLMPVSVAQKLRVIFDPSALTTFHVEERRGRAVAVFQFYNRERAYDGVIFCKANRRYLAVFDKQDTVPNVLRDMKNFPAEFVSNDKPLPARATYARATAQAPAYVIFDLPGLDPHTFAGDGLELVNILNPSIKRRSKKDSGKVDSTLVNSFAWADGVNGFAFAIVADNGPQTLPLVFRDCK